MRKENIIAYNAKMLSKFFACVFDDLHEYVPSNKELNALKTGFDMLRARSGKSRFKQDKIKKIIYYSAIGALDDDERCRSKELKKMITSLKNRFVKADYSYNNQLE